MRTYKGRKFNREQIHVCGNYLDADIYPVFQKPGKRRARCKPSSEIQKRLNQRNAEKKLTRLIHANFSEEDIALHLTYRSGEEPADEEAAQRDLSNFLRRLKRRYAKAGLELRYISTTEYGKKTGRVHHHLIISGGFDRDEAEKLWGKGYANSKRLQFEDEGLGALAHYMAKDHRFYKRWNQSRNLIMPTPVQYDGKISGEDIEEMRDAIDERAAHIYFEERYPEFELLSAEYINNSCNGGTYIRIEMRRRNIPR